MLHLLINVKKYQPLLVFSWIRMGVPADLTEYLVAMDWYGHLLVRGYVNSSKGGL